MTDRAGRSYWDKHWEASRLSGRRSRLVWLRGHWRRAFEEYFRSAFGGTPTQGQTLLEIGCADSLWLPYFASTLGFHVSGIDYSPEGCRQARVALEKVGATGEIVCENLFTPPGSMVGAFDVVVSFGVVEHFENTAACVAAIARFLKPGGLLVTSIPNLKGLVGLMQRTLNRPIYDMHVPLGPAELRDATEQAGLDVMSCGYFMSTNFGVCNLNGIPIGSLRSTAKRTLLTAAIGLTAEAWLFEELVTPLPASRWVSPYINCIAKEPDGSNPVSRR